MKLFIISDIHGFYDDLIEAYNEYIENDIHYCVETFDLENYTHIDILDEQKGEVYNV